LADMLNQERDFDSVWKCCSMRTVMRERWISLKPELFARHRSHVTRHTSHVTPHTSHLTPHTSHLTPHTSHLTPLTSHLTPHTSHLTPHTSHVTRHTSHVTRHTSHVTRHITCIFLSPLPVAERSTLDFEHHRDQSN
jgi:hypothetical protein